MPSFKLYIVLFCIGISAILGSGATLPAGEVNALKSIAKSLGKTNWNFSVDPCSGDDGWAANVDNSEFQNAVTCDCSFNRSTACHIVSIVLKSQNLSGTLPKDLSGLPYLQEFDLSRNYLNGTIPPQWGKSKLVNISLLGNRLSGSIPKEFGSMTTLVNLTIEYNELSGVLPQELGNLTNLEKLFLSSNNFTGTLPSTFVKLTALKDFRIADTNFAGPLPELITNWVRLEKLMIQGSGFTGPIPSKFSQLVNLEEIRLSDLKGGVESPFPFSSNMNNLTRLILRNCSISGTLPEFLANMTGLKTIDLSFNKLNGTIPDSYSQLRRTQYIYLTGNNLSGEVPSWMIDRGRNIDISYNNFTFNGNCQEGYVNLFSSFASKKKSRIASCSTACKKKAYGFNVNAGGKSSEFGKTKFDEDTTREGPSSFVPSSNSNWAYSNTGYFMDDDQTTDIFIVSKTNASLSQNDNDIYSTARISPLSLTYVGYCLVNGNYTVNLHFAEIQFSNDSTYASLGRRVFDVYIQGKMVLNEFNIAAEAGGAGKPLVKNFTAVVVDNSLEIQFYWAGKGTTALPKRGTYGPLVSAISVSADFEHASENSSNKIWVIIGAIVGAALAVVFILLILWWRRCLCDNTPSDLKGIDLQTGSFSLRHIKAATNNFDPENKIGEGGFGPVYKGKLSDGTVIAVKKLSAKSKQGNKEFVNEIGVISALQHPHLVKLYGCCIEGQQLHLVYEYMENNSLARALFGSEEHRLHLDWPSRRKICVGIARGLAYLHEESVLKIVHRDIKATNVLLDKNLNPKISDFGLAKLDDDVDTHISTRIAGTFGYMAPEYAMRGRLTEKADVYSFGIVALEIVSGRSNSSHVSKHDTVYLLDTAHELRAQDKVLELVDKRLGMEFNQDEAMDMINVGLMCTNVAADDRPAMSAVVSMLEGKMAVKNVAVQGDMKTASLTMKKHYEMICDETESQTRSFTRNGPWTGSSSSAVDLYANSGISVGPSEQL